MYTHTRMLVLFSNQTFFFLCPKVYWHNTNVYGHINSGAWFIIWRGIGTIQSYTFGHSVHSYKYVWCCSLSAYTAVCTHTMTVPKGTPSWKNVTLGLYLQEGVRVALVAKYVSVKEVSCPQSCFPSDPAQSGGFSYFVI